LDYFLPNINFKILLPNFFSKPDFVVGIPVCRANFCLAEVMPKALFQENEKPNLFAIDFMIGSIYILFIITQLGIGI
jgi:hypothetical protein